MSLHKWYQDADLLVRSFNGDVIIDIRNAKRDCEYVFQDKEELEHFIAQLTIHLKTFRKQ